MTTLDAYQKARKEIAELDVLRKKWHDEGKAFPPSHVQAAMEAWETVTAYNAEMFTRCRDTVLSGSREYEAMGGLEVQYCTSCGRMNACDPNCKIAELVTWLDAAIAEHTP